MDPKYVPVLDLFKYPILIFSILGALIIAQKSEVPIHKISVDGIELKELIKEIDSANTKGNLQDQELYVRVAALETSLKAITESAPEAQQKEIQQKEVTQLLNEETVSEKVAQLSAKKENNGTYLKGKQGWVYIGKVVDNVWRPFHFRTIEYKKPSEFPDEDNIGEEYRVSANLVLRKEKPNPDLSMPESAISQGVIPKSTKVTLLAKPEIYLKNGQKVCWAKVEVKE